MQRKRIRPHRRKANHVIKQMETPQVRDSGDRRDRWYHRGRIQQPRSSTDSGDSRGAVYRHRGQHLRAHAEASAVPTERKSVEVARTQHSMMIQTSSVHRSRRFMKHSSGKREIPEIMQRQALMVHNVQTNRSLARRDERSRNAAQQSSKQRRHWQL